MELAYADGIRNAFYLKIYFVAGINRHFQMVFIHDKLNSSVSKKIPTTEIWKHLNELYDLQALVSAAFMFSR